jgi:L-fuculokinase
MAKTVTAVFDIGKTNKKFFLFDQDLKEVHHEYVKLPLAQDDDGYPCDDLNAITAWITKTIDKIIKTPDYQLVAVNFSTYGATLVHLDERGQPVTPLYNYLKPLPQDMAVDFQRKYDGENNDLETASPFLGMLNSGLQLYWLKHSKPRLFRKIRHILHFPQYLSYTLTGQLVSEPTSIGCHTKLWDFEKKSYHRWVVEEGLAALFPEIVPATHSFGVDRHGRSFKVGVGIHDSSSALASYLLRTDEPFLLVSTGTWSIAMNPFTRDSLSVSELQRDCLNYLTIAGKPVKSSRLFLGHELSHQLQMLNRLFDKDNDYYKKIELNKSFQRALEEGVVQDLYYPETIENKTILDDVFYFRKWDASACSSYEEAYHHVMWGLVRLQVASIRLALGSSTFKMIFVDGGFVDNDIYIKLLRHFLPGYSIEASFLPLGSAYGAAAVLQNKLAATPGTVQPGN